MMLPLERIMEAVARGNGEMQGQQQAKKVATQQAEEKKRMSVTLTPMPGSAMPLVSIKNAPADLLNQTQESDLEKAYTTPKENVERVLSGAQRNEERLRDYGFAPKTSDVQRTDVDQFGERYRARRELGGGVIKSAIMAGITGGRTDEKLVENLKNTRAAQNSATTQKFVNPLADQDAQEAGVFLELGRLEKGHREEQRLGTGQYLQLRNQLLDQKNVIQYGDEESFLKAAGEGMNVVGGMRTNDADLFRRAFRTGRVSFLGDRVKSLSGEEGKLAIQSYGNTPEEIERFVDEQAGSSNLSDFERQRFRRTAKGLLDWKAAQEQKEADARANQDRADQRIALAIASSNRAEGEKPRKLTAFDTSNASVDALLSAKGDVAFEQTSVTQALRNREGVISKEHDSILQQLSANDLAAEQIRQQLKKPGFKNDESLLKELRTKQEKGRQLVLRQRALATDLLKVRGDAAPSAAAPPSPPSNTMQIEFITQQEYDALIAAGETPATIALDGLQVK
jgi:hypothetical protein